MKIKKEHIITFAKAANRDLELAVGRVNYNRLHQDKTKYNRKKFKKVLAEC